MGLSYQVAIDPDIFTYEVGACAAFDYGPTPVRPYWNGRFTRDDELGCVWVGDGTIGEYLDSYNSGQYYKLNFADTNITFHEPSNAWYLRIDVISGIGVSALIASKDEGSTPAGTYRIYSGCMNLGDNEMTLEVTCEIE